MADPKTIALNTRNSRRKIPIDSDTVHFQKLQKGLSLGYRKGLREGSWVARRYDEDGTYSREPLGTADDVASADGITVLSFDQAQELARQWFKDRAAANIGGVIASNYTVENAINDYYKKLAADNWAPQDKTKKLAKAHILPELGPLKLSELTHNKVKAWRDRLAETPPRRRTPKRCPQRYLDVDMNDPEVKRRRRTSTNRIMAVLQAALNHAYDNQIVATKAGWERIKPFRHTDGAKARHLTFEEVNALVNNCAPDLRWLVQGALVTGARYGELIALTVGNFSAQHKYIHVVRGKNGKPRYIKLNDQGVELFQELTKDRVPSEHMFLRRNERPWGHSEQKALMDNACKAAGLQGVTFHILRHSYASLAVMNGMAIIEVAKVLGHADTRVTTKHYAHLADDYLERVVREKAPVYNFGDPTTPDKPFIVPKAANAS